ncbi:MAG: hypothetical protein JSS20_10265 [Proteobacteria bacterium]|nr:hypothetical protein [Pseudomonadota bacterium]
MIYMVEMQFNNSAREHDWHTWYLAHTMNLAREVPGFNGSQRFRAMTATPSPWLAMHEVAGPQVFESAEYRSVGGPASTGEWQHEHSNWHRNLFSGLEQTPDVAFDEHLLIADDAMGLPAEVAAEMTWLDGVGLDRTIKRRGIAVVGPKRKIARLTPSMFGAPVLRVYRPIMPRIVH